MRFANVAKTGEFFAEMALQHTGHQAVHGTAYGGNLLKHGRAVSPLFERRFQRIQLPSYPAHTAQYAFFLSR
ncbi:hypothetical protein GCM10017655_43180 [Pseudomonas turukhanskensis]|uniref:Uncharacterized protein n=1 Tax=Pseudomonas turukhanskensis TaxID=1806536 RepID=A0A9W6NGX4_9PSED|nr:hypothetical protein GCM10017655_43180 [Pseudomonas turukhanskensis]